MDDPKTTIFDISSDEESGYGGGGGGDGGGGGGDGDGDGESDGDDYKWISDLLHDEAESYSDDTVESDDVVVVSEVCSNPQQMKKSSIKVAKSNKDVIMGGGGDGAGGDDDDCVVLDGDPEKPVLIENHKKDDDSDELVVTGEKGEVACRDFPHSRHLCAKYPFTSTPHEKHCDQCHCYVCDSLAPCVGWGTGISTIDHCHATDKDAFWKAERKNSMRNDKAPLVVPGVTDTTLPRMPSHPTYPPPFTSNLVPQNQLLRPTIIRPCSVPNSNGMLESTRRGRIYHLASAVPVSKSQPHLLSQHLRGRTPNNVNLGPQFTSSRATFKRVGPGGPNIRGGFRTSNPSYVIPRNHPASALLFKLNVGQVPNSIPTQPIIAGPGPGPGPGPGNEFTNYLPPLPQMLSQQHISSGYANNVPQTPSQQHAAHGLVNSVPFQPLISSQRPMRSNFGNSFPSQPQVASQPHVGGSFENPLPLLSQPQVASQPHVGGSFENPLLSPTYNGDQTYNYLEPSQPRVSNQFEAGNAFQLPVPSQSMPSFGSMFETPPSPYQPQEYTVLPNSSMQLGGNQTLDGSSSNPAVSDFSWVTNTSPSSQQQVGVGVGVGNPQFQSAEPETRNNPAMNVEHFSSVIPSSPDFAPSELKLDNWFFENDNISDALETSVPPGLNVPSPEPASADGGLFFGF